MRSLMKIKNCGPKIEPCGTLLQSVSTPFDH